jgi:hypothetical protein
VRVCPQSESVDARRLQSAIRSFERLIEDDRPTRAALASLARLHAMRAVALAKAGACSEALVEISIAIDYDQGDGQLHQTQRELSALMESICQQAAAMGHAVDPRINPEDLVLVAEARRGFAPMKLYQSSRRAVQTRAIARQCAS